MSIRDGSGDHPADHVESVQFFGRVDGAIPTGKEIHASALLGIEVTDVTGLRRTVRGLFTAVSLDGGKTWPYKRLVSAGPRPRAVQGTNGSLFVMSERNAEPSGYLSVCQAADDVIHLISSKQHYAFNLQWLNTPPPAAPVPRRETADPG